MNSENNKHDEFPMITVPCIVCDSPIPVDALEEVNVITAQKMCRACKQAIMAMKLQMELDNTKP